jgi:glycosyltransferase involved in cell wall biosynthesis
MRIVQVAHWFLPRHLAGTEIYTYGLARELSKRHEVHVYCREDGFLDREFHETDEVYEGLLVRRVYFNLIGVKANPFNQALIEFKNSTIEGSFRRFLHRVKPDIVHFQHLFKLSASLVPLAKKMGFPVIVTLHDYWFICYNIQLVRPELEVCSGPFFGLKCAGCAKPDWLYGLRVLLGPLLTPLFMFRTVYTRRCLEQADLIITPSAFLKEKFVAHGFSSNSILVSSNGTRPLSCYKRGQAEGLRFGYIGTVQKHKGVHVLVEAFNHIDDPSVELKIFGDPLIAPDYYARLQRRARNPRIQFSGVFDNAEVGRILSEIDVLIVPSVWPENSPVTIHEAYLAKIPAIASRIGGIPELVQDGVNGFLFTPGYAKDLLSKMCLFIEDRSLLERLRANIGSVKTIEENARELEAIYERLIAGEAL